MRAGWDGLGGRGMLMRYKEKLDEMKAEVAAVLYLMDGLAEQWGDEAVFRRCRDRLRKMIGDHYER